MMRRFWTWLRKRDEFGDSPISLAACVAVFFGAIACLMHMPGY